jgi:SAM-dependent methyltransferase
MDQLDRQAMLALNQAGWDHVGATSSGRDMALPLYGPLAPTEEELQLLDDLAGARVLEVGCGGGYSLAYLAGRGASELWGLDLSSAQIERASATLRGYPQLVCLFCSPMEENPGLPAGYFDLVLSIYGLGWATDLERTLALIASYLKPGGALLFSREHPIYHCLEYRAGHMLFAQPYGREGPDVQTFWHDRPIVIQRRKVSTFVNALVGAGLTIERMVETDLNTAQAQAKDAAPERWYSVPRAHLAPTTLILKARKPA